MFRTKLVVLLALLSLAACCPPNCNDCDPTSLVCFACIEGFELSVTGSCVDATTVAKCTLYGPTNQCFVCQPTYSLDNNGNCLKSGSPCLATDPSNNSLCTSCGFGTLLQNGQCLGSINCNSPANPCPACLPGFTLTAGNCVDGTGNCKTVGSNGVCVTCISGFALNGYTCQPVNLAVYACYIRDSNSSCLVCKSGYNLYQGYCLLPSQIQQILQGTTTLQAILLQRTLALTTTTTTTVTTTAGNSNAFGSTNTGFGSTSTSFGSTTTNSGSTTTSSSSGFGGFSDSSFGSFGGFGTTSTSSTTSSTSSGSGFGTSTGSGFGTSTGSGFGTTTTTTTPNIPNCSVPDTVNIGQCLTCATGYYIVPNGCAQVSPLCLSYSVTGNGNCLSCKYNLQLTNGACVDQNCLAPSGNTCARCAANFAVNSNGVCQFSDPNCLSPLAASCGQCQSNYFVTSQGICMLLPAYCLAANPQTYLCSQCANGYTLSNSGVCAMPPPQPPSTLPAHCLAVEPVRPNFCSLCEAGYDLIGGVCYAMIYPFCASYNAANTVCLSCQTGYSLSNNACVPTAGGAVSVTTTSTTTATAANRDPNCVRYTNNNCDACSLRYYFGTNGLCVPVNPNCNNYTTAGACTSCFPGFVVSGTNCILSGSAKDPYCRTVNAGGICTACYSNYFYNVAAALCQPLNPLCNSSNLTDGSCLSCYPGYSISGGKCVIYFQDANCQKFDANKNCLTCSTGYYLNPNGKCQQLSPLCKTSNTATGACTSCYPGYVLQGPSCVVGGATTMDVNCAQFNLGACVKCSNGYFLNSNSVCTQLNTLCKTSNTATGACLTCYPGYALQGNNCVLSTSSTASADPNCKSTSTNGVCNTCYGGFFLTAQSTCQRTDPLCKTYTPNMSQCASCFDGYSLFQGQCIIATQVPAANSDQFCIKSQGVYCLTCANGYYLAPTGNCSQLNPLCKGSDLNTGRCTDCYPGYSLSAGTCIIAAAVNIPYCATVSGIVCSACISGYYVSNGSCALANMLCATYDPYNGTCYSCIPGYIYQDLGCIFPALGIDNNCLSYSTGGYCNTCAPKYALVQYICTLIDPNCLQFNNIQNVCVVCGNGKTPNGPNCV